MRSPQSKIFKAIACLLICLAHVGAALPQEQATDRSVLLTVTVTDPKGRYVSGLDKEHFSLTDKKREHEITSFANDNGPMSVAILIDKSGSMTGNKPRLMADWVAHFIGGSNIANEYLIIEFTTETKVLCDWDCGDKNLLAALYSLSVTAPQKQTAFYDACDFALRKIQTRSRTRRALVMMTDGLDNESKISFTQLRRSLKQSDVMIYAVGLLSGSNAGSSLGMEPQGVMDELASITGGKAFFPRSATELTEIAEQISLELKTQYRIGLKLDTPPDHQFHSIKVKVAPLVLPTSKKPLQLNARCKPEFYDP